QLCCRASVPNTIAAHKGRGCQPFLESIERLTRPALPKNSLSDRKSAQIVIIGIEIFCRLALGPLDLCLFQPRCDGAAETCGDLILQLKHDRAPSKLSAQRWAPVEASMSWPAGRREELFKRALKLALEAEIIERTALLNGGWSSRASADGATASPSTG